MTTFIAFSPSAVSPFSFTATLDGQQYLVTVTWSLFGQRWYINIVTLDGQLVVANYPRVGSPPGFDINLVGAWFVTSTLVFRESSGQFEINP